jgi:hypothetical protein
MDMRKIKFKINGNDLTFFGRSPFELVPLDERHTWSSEFIHYLDKDGFLTVPGKLKVKVEES